jgi:hypothetical protein
LLERLNIPLALIIVVIAGFFALRWIGRIYLTGKWRAEAVAAATMLAFVLGVVSPFSGRHLWAIAVSAPVAAAAPAAPPAVGSDVTADCAKVRAVAPAGPDVLGNLDVIGDMVSGRPEARTTGFTIDKDGAVMVQGWAADGTTKTAAVAACLLVDGKVVPAATATYGTARPDVATAYSLPAMGATGFMLTFGTSGLARGKHAISVAGVTTRGATALSSVDTVVVP